MPDEIVIKVEGETPPEPVAPVVIVTDETPAPTGDALGAALAVMTLESLAEDNANLRSRIESLESGRDGLYERIGRLEVAEIIEDQDEPPEAIAAVGELVTEIPPPILPEDSVKPTERKRRFV